MERFLEDMKLKHHYKEKVSMSTILQIDAKAITDEPVKSKTDIAWYFLKRLMMANVTARNVNCASVSDPDSSETSAELNLEELLACSNSDMLNPLDIITALFLCSDGFVQQELSLKMSMCQFAVPLLLPNCDTNQCTLMLWAMRDIVKKYRPQSLSESKGFKEEHIVLSEIPMFSFVRLGECSLSKSKILNQLLSNSQQYHDFFVHRDMESGDCPRTLSNGLAEITWYLPCGNKNIDIFSEPVAVANLRGDIASFETQFSFLCQTSSAVFVFCDILGASCKQLVTTKGKAQLFLVSNQQSQNFSLPNLNCVAKELKLTNSNIILKTKQKNDADFVMTLQKTIRSVVMNVKNTKMKMGLEQMVSVAREFGIPVDEDCPECQNAKKNADAITAKIKDIPRYKETQLPRQGQIWKELTSLEKEEFRLKKVGSDNLEHYKSKLNDNKIKLRFKQNSYEISEAMAGFISAISTPGIERSYFLKWLQINLDHLSREKLSGLREQYKEKSKISDNKQELKRIDEQLSNSSLGIEHFIREMSQIYEASVSLPESHPSRQQLQHLPRLCAQLLLDGFPLELVDGDASNIPLKWVSDVLAQLHTLTPNNKILVVTVLGVQSTGKSTLLNTMFGVQFAVSSGRCTRGAFMLLIRISEDVKQTLNCDFLVIIDTEGLKSPELAQLDDSHEHDNELATLVVGLSDITIINIAMENSTEMKDILQIVVHAFLRMKEVGKKPKCQFVHQNVSDVSAHEKNLRDRELLLQQLDEMTQAAAKMERKEKYKSFTDVMEYNPDTGNWYIPGLWNGTPPMAPVNTGYSEAVYELKKNIIQLLEKSKSSVNTISDFCEWIRSLWTAVKHENFIFSFRNSLVADAYMKLCTEVNKWEWDFKQDMYKRSTDAETRIKNFGTVKSEQSDIGQLVTTLKTQLLEQLSKWENTLLTNLKEYFKKKEGHVYLVECYKQEFENSVKSLRNELESSVKNQLNAAADIKQGMADVDKIKKSQTKQIEDKVGKLIESCRKKQAEMTDEDLDREFDKMWGKTLNELQFKKQTPLDILSKVALHLLQNLQAKGSHACEALSKKSLKDCGRGPYKYSAEGLKHLKQQFCKFFRIEDAVKTMQSLADRIIAACDQHVKEKVVRKNNYHDTYIEEILHIIDDMLNKEDIHKDTEFEVSLKQHICAVAARQFQQMHENFLHENDPLQCLIQNKDKFCADFKDVFYKRDQCQKKAQEFTEQCLRLAVEDYINRHLGSDIVTEMQTFSELKVRMSFQSTVLLELLQNDNFNEYLRYTQTYENYVSDWIQNRILTHFPDSSHTLKFEETHIAACVSIIKAAINKAKGKKCENIKEFVENICSGFGDKLVISQNALNTLFFLNNADKETFTQCLTKCVDEMRHSLKEKLRKSSIQKKLQNLYASPQNELFKNLIGCGKQCPFCNVPCEAGSKTHSEHWATLHRPQALGAYRYDDSKKLVVNICSTDVSSNTLFSCSATKGQWHPYKDYKEIYPDWKINPDCSLEASDYWKYVLARFNNRFATEFNANPADIPPSWNSITKERAEESVKKTYSC